MPLQPRSLLALVLLICAITLTQSLIHRVRGEAADFGVHTDEASHFITGLMVRDYVANGFPQNPVEFAKTYYQHYPKVSFGSWPPLFHIAVGFWMLVAPATRGSAVVYVEVLTAALAVLGYWVARRSLPPALAVAVGVGVWLAAVPQFSTRIVQADTQYALLSALAVYLFAAYVERPSGVAAVWVGLTFFGALLTKNNALFLPISFGIIVLARRGWSILRRVDFYLAIVPGALAMAIWQWLTLPFVRNNMKGMTAESTPGLTLFVYAAQLFQLVWPGLIPFALLGIWLLIVRPLLLRKQIAYVDSASLALLLGPMLFHSMLPHDVNQRYLLPSLAPLLIFAAHGLDYALSLGRLARISPVLRRAVASAAVAATAVAGLTLAPLPARGYSRIAGQLAAGATAGEPTALLIVGSFNAEGMLIGEMIVREPRPTHWLLRGYKILRRQTGVLNRHTELVKTDPGEMLSYLQQLPVTLVAIAEDGEPESAAQRTYMRSMMAAHPDLFVPWLREPVGADCANAPCVIEVYRLMGTRNGPFAADKLPRDMPLWKGL